VGGFPEYVKQRVDDILNYVLEDILIRERQHTDGDTGVPPVERR